MYQHFKGLEGSTDGGGRMKVCYSNLVSENSVTRYLGQFVNNVKSSGQTFVYGTEACGEAYLRRLQS